MWWLEKAVFGRQDNTKTQKDFFTADLEVENPKEGSDSGIYTTDQVRFNLLLLYILSVEENWGVVIGKDYSFAGFEVKYTDYQHVRFKIGLYI